MGGVKPESPERMYRGFFAMATAEAINWMRTGVPEFFSIRPISILPESPFTTRGKATRRWSGNAVTAWRCLISFGNIANSEKVRSIATTKAEDMIREENVLPTFDRWTDEFADFVQGKGKVPSGKYRAYGYKAPGHLLRDAQLLWRNIGLRTGVPPKDSSPAQQQELGLNRDQTWSSHESEGEKLRRKK